MWRYIEKIRRQPEDKKRKSVLLISAAITAIIVIVWAVGLVVRIEGTDFSMKSADPGDQYAPNLGQSFSNVFQQFARIFSNASDFNNSNSTTSSGQ